MKRKEINAKKDVIQLIVFKSNKVELDYLIDLAIDWKKLQKKLQKKGGE